MSPTIATELRAAPEVATLELGALGLDAGAHVLVAHALRSRAPDQPLRVQGSHPELGVHLSGWCRQRGLTVSSADGAYWIAPGTGE
ncbi:MAG: hypothetical protein EPN40_01350, partial [Rhodanobacteraceae bacterium]